MRDFLSFCIARAKSCVMHTTLCLAEDFSKFLTEKTVSLSSLIANLAMIGRGRKSVMQLLGGLPTRYGYTTFNIF